LNGGRLVIHVAAQHKVRRPVERGGDIHVWISPKQKEAFLLIAQSIEIVEPISYKELASKMSVSVGTVQHHLARLKMMGLIETANTKRSIRLTDLGRAAIEQHKARKRA
jgi:Mn-dependent DtxR family transcriptional regulator